MSENSIRLAVDFMENETQFHLGFLPTEQSSPLTKDLDKRFAASCIEGVRCLQNVDNNVLEMARRIFKSAEFAKLVETGKKTLASGGKIVFSGCGATGRLSILLECMWRDCCAKNPAVASYADQVFSIMTGGDYALVRSVEFFEDVLEEEMVFTADGHYTLSEEPGAGIRVCEKTLQKLCVESCSFRA